jgi:hypothetical protein
MKKILITTTLLICIAGFFSTHAQEKYVSLNGNIQFYSKTTLEDIKAENKQVQAMLNTTTYDIVFKVVMKNFRFAKAAMQDHFNGKQFLDTEKFPNASFEGKIVNNQQVDFSKPGKYNAEVEGKLTIRGVSKLIKEKGIIEVEDNQIKLTSTFFIELDDYEVKIPGNYVNNISNSLQITLDAILTPFTR